MKIRLVKSPGAEAAAFVDKFYAENGGLAKARPGDLFFLAYSDQEILGSVRYCVEEGTPMLRSMMVHRDWRGQGLGQQLLEEFAAYLDIESIRKVYCLPFAHLEAFYAKAGFVRAHHDEVPKFLQTRMIEYNTKPKKVICMRRD